MAIDPRRLYIIACRDDDNSDGSKGDYVLATRTRFATRIAATEYAMTIAEGREAIVIECPKGLSYSNQGV